MWAVPYPSSQAKYVPLCGLLEPCAVEITPELAVHGVVPDSKPGLPSS